jgi:hypothetical protein
LVDAQEKSAIRRSVAGVGNFIEQRTLNFNSMRRQEWPRLSPDTERGCWQCGSQAAFINAGEDLHRNGRRGFVSATLPGGTMVRDERALRARLGVEVTAGHTENPFANHPRRRTEMLEVEARSLPIP